MPNSSTCPKWRGKKIIIQVPWLLITQSDTPLKGFDSCEVKS